MDSGHGGRAAAAAGKGPRNPQDRRPRPYKEEGSIPAWRGSGGDHRPNMDSGDGGGAAAAAGKATRKRPADRHHRRRGAVDWSPSASGVDLQVHPQAGATAAAVEEIVKEADSSPSSLPHRQESPPALENSDRESTRSKRLKRYRDGDKEVTAAAVQEIVQEADSTPSLSLPHRPLPQSNLEGQHRPADGESPRSKRLKRYKDEEKEAISVLEGSKNHCQQILKRSTRLNLGEPKLGKIEGICAQQERVGSRQQILEGKSICLLGFSAFAEQEMQRKILALGGTTIVPALYTTRTYICLSDDPGEESARGTRVITAEWIRGCYATGKDPKKVQIESNSDDILLKNHQLFVCKCDQSKIEKLPEVLTRIKEKRITFITPGNSSMSNGHKSIVTVDTLKTLIKKLYLLMEALNRAGYTLRGKFDLANFAVDEAKGEQNVRFFYPGELPLERSDTEGKLLDKQSFRRMVRDQIFKQEMPPHDLRHWLKLLEDTKIEGMISDSVLLMPLEICSGQFMTLYSEFRNSNPAVQQEVMTILNCYNGWKEELGKPGTNILVAQTFGHTYKDEQGNFVRIYYSNDIWGLLRLFRNNSQHASAAFIKLLALIIGQHFPDLMADLQRALFLARKKYPQH